VIQEEQGWFASKWGRLSTGWKMFLILSLGLLPLGLIAILASVESARENEVQHAREVHARVQLKAQRINAAISRSVLTIRAASAAITSTGGNSDACRMTLRRLERAQGSHGRYALYAGGNVLGCASLGFIPPSTISPPDGERSLVEIDPAGTLLRFAVFDEKGQVEGYGELSRKSLGRIAELPGTTTGYDLELLQGNRRIIVHQGYKAGALNRTVETAAPVAGGRLQLRIRAGTVPITPAEMLMTLLPIIMWLFASLFGWLVLDRLLLRPLMRMQRAVAAYRPGDSSLDLPPVSTPAREIGELGLAFDQVTRTVARHEAELEAAIDRQTRLVREVHHRVKNNLQVVASLLNLHARGATSEDAAAAYASIQRRVDALAVVHRNHFAELEENRGVALKPLIAELGANLRATAPAVAGNMQIRLDIEPFYSTQDVAVSVAFLVTELVEFAMFCGAPFVAIALEGQSASTARLSIESAALRSGTPCDEKLFERFERIVTGLSRQLRSAVDRDMDAGRFALNIAVLAKGDK
jgi:hypothetical protein